MKKLLAVAALTLMAATSAQAISLTSGTGNHQIMGSPHDLTNNATSAGIYGGTGLVAGKQQICIFCHTPHNPVKNIPLWNRNAPAVAASSYKYYNSSPSLTTTARTTSKLYDDSISMFCMSCHDGATALGAIANKADTGVSLGNNLTTGLSLKAKIGDGAGDISNSHPIGFDYWKAQQEDNGLRLNAVNSPTFLAAFGAIAPLFKSNNGANVNQIECASCHKVHDDFYPPFLRTSNVNSGLCLACHNK